MTRGALVGDARGALTTAVGLLYAAQVRRSNASPDYRFSVPPASQAVVSRLYSSLQEGVSPDSPGADALAKVTFAMDFPDSFGKKLFGGIGRGRSVGDAHELDLGVIPLVQQDGASTLAPPPDAWGAAVEVDLLVLVADASPGGAPNGRLDAGIDQFLALIPKGVPKCVALWILAAPPFPELPPPSAADARGSLSKSTFTRHLPTTAARISAARQNPPSFFAWLEATRGGGQKVKRRQLFDAGGIEPKYPYEEFTGLFDALAALSK